MHQSKNDDRVRIRGQGFSTAQLVMLFDACARVASLLSVPGTATAEVQDRLVELAEKVAQFFGSRVRQLASAQQSATPGLATPGGSGSSAAASSTPSGPTGEEISTVFSHLVKMQEVFDEKRSVLPSVMVRNGKPLPHSKANNVAKKRMAEHYDALRGLQRYQHSSFEGFCGGSAQGGCDVSSQDFCNKLVQTVCECAAAGNVFSTTTSLFTKEKELQLLRS